MSVVVVQPAPNVPTHSLPITNGSSEHAQEISEQPRSKSLIGIIYPPPEVRNIIDRTAEFVARNGAAYETKVRDSETGNNKFNFLHPTDPYHAYYRMRVNEFKEGKAVPNPIMHITTGSAPRPSIQTIKLDSLVPKEAPNDFEFISEPPSISSLDLDFVKLTALFAAQHGRSFVNRLMDKEQKNYQFDFLRPQHSLFTYFNKLIEQYQRVLLHPKNILDSLSRDLYSTDNLFDRVENRFHWNMYQRRQRQGEEEKNERERVAYAQIDWHDFVVVETINFTEEESGFFPPPVTPHTLTARLIAQAKHEAKANAEPGEEAREVEMEDELLPAETAPQPDKEPDPVPQIPVIDTAPPVQEGDIIIRSDYDPKARPKPPTAGPGVDKFLASPITGEIVSSQKATSHVKHLLVDAKWRESQAKLGQQQHQQVEVYAEGSQITQSLRGLAERRTDIFGSEETVIGRTIGEEQGPEAMALASELAEGGVLDDALKALKYTIEESPKIGPSMPQKLKPVLVPAIPPPRPMPPAIPHVPLPPHAPLERPPAPVMPPGPPPRPMGDLRPHFPMQPPNPGLMPRAPMPGNFPPPMLAPQPFMHPPNPDPMHPRPPHFPPLSLDPGPKRPRTEEEMLVHEEEFVRFHPGPVSFRVHCPQLPEKPEWNLNGQILTITLPVQDQVSVVKAMIAGQIDMPIGKQKLQLGTIFLKDSNSLAFYNFSEESVVQLVVKERGGRKK